MLWLAHSIAMVLEAEALGLDTSRRWWKGLSCTQVWECL